MPWKFPHWPCESQKWDNNSLELLRFEKVKTDEIKVKEILEKSDEFPIKFPLETVRCKYLKQTVSDAVLERNINSVYPIVHEKVLYLCAQFLLYKKSKGSAKERAFYANLSLTGFIERLLTKKAVVFVGHMDGRLLLDGSEGVLDWELIGTPKETEKLNLTKCLSYDELKLSALLSVSSYTYFINDGNRKNCGKPEHEGVEEEGIIVSIIGTRLVKPNAMEYEEILVHKEQNTKSNGYGKEGTFKALIADFYEEESLTYDQVAKKFNKKDGRYEWSRDVYFDNVMFAKRLSLSFDTLVLEANERGKSANKMAFVHVVGIGLGVWRAFNHQRDLFLEICIKRLLFLRKTLTNISDVFFDYFSEDSIPLGIKHNDKILIEDHPGEGIRVSYGRRNPHEKLSGEHEGKLLVVSYAADSNSMPGNEFWHGAVHHSSDSAAAASTQIAELHNPHINKNVTVGNLRVATLEGVLSLEKYIEKITGGVS